MTKLRVYEYAKQLNMSSKEILTILSRLDVPVANHMSVMDPEMVEKVERFFSEVKQRAAQRHATEVEKELREKQRQRERNARSAGTEQRNNQENKHSSGNGSRTSGGTGASRIQTDDKDYWGGRRTDGMNGMSGVRRQEGQRSSGLTGTGTLAAGADSRSVAAAMQATRTLSGSAIERVEVDGEPQTDTSVGVANGSQEQHQGLTPVTGSTNEREQNRGQSITSDGVRDNRGTESPSQDSLGEHRVRPVRSTTGSGTPGAGNTGGTRTGGYSGDRSGGARSGSTGGARTGGYSGDRSSPARGGNNGGGDRSGRRAGVGSDRASSRFSSASRPAGVAGSGTGSGSVKPVSATAKAKEKERERKQTDYRDRKEGFNEDKLVRNRSRRRPSGENGVNRNIPRVELPQEVTVEGPQTVADFAKLIKREPSDIIKKLLFLGVMATINQEIDTDAMELIASEYKVKLNVVEPVDEEALDMLMQEDKPEDLQPRPPVVTIMGHVDHGKTTLLDAIRDSHVTATESGGITQHIGAYQVEVNGRKITFLDTPGHEAFTTMRARGAQVTDITILVVAADDGVMPQTVEAINHANAANVPIIVAINKVDKPGANPDRVKQELTQHGLVAEEWGGDTVFVEISALKREGLDNLLEMVLLVTDLREVKANPHARPRGTVIEAKLDRGRGPVATVLVQNGTLRIGDVVVAGTTYGHVRAMINDRSKRIKEAGPSTPVEIQGLGGVPSAGDLFVVYDDERPARNLADKRLSREKVEQMQTTSRVTLDDLYRQIKEGNVKELNVIVKADVQGSVEALVQSIEKIEIEGVRVKVIHKGAGAITESDVSLASASNAIIIGFHVRPDVNARRAAEAEQVDVRLYRVIYNVTEELEAAMRGMLDPEEKEVVLGHAEVRQTFHISRIGTVAGCYVTDGKVTRDAECRIVRDGVVVYEGNLDSLKRFKDDAREVATGFECGITLEKFNDIKVGDVLEVFKMEAVKTQ